MNRQAANMGFVDDCVGPVMPGWLITVPIEPIVGKEALRCVRRVVHPTGGKVFPGGGSIETESTTQVPMRSTEESRTVRVQQELPAVEPMALFRSVRPLDAKGIELAIGNPLHPHMPHIPRAMPPGIQIDGHGRHTLFGTVEQFQPYPGGIPAEKGKIDSAMAVISPGGYRPANIYLDRFPHRCYFSSLRDSAAATADLQPNTNRWYPLY